MSDLNRAIEQLNAEQRRAVEHGGNTVVLAGPGSGKTDTIVLKVALLLHRDVASPRGVACITYGNDAVQEFTHRLKAYGLRTGQRLFLGTVHSFCLQRVLRPFAALAGLPHLARPRVLTPSEQRSAVTQTLDRCGLDDDPRRFENTLTKIRRAIACADDLQRFDERHVHAASIYTDLLHKRGAVDFEEMTLTALKIIESNDDVRELLVARFPWVAIDEYQDLGGPLHRIVLALQASKCNIFAVGDPDQCIFDFTGADPRYLTELEDHAGFDAVRLRFNYRSGSRIIAAAEASLGDSRDYLADPNRADSGRIDFDQIDGGLRSQAQFIIGNLIPGLVEEGFMPEQIAVLYKQKGEVLDALTAELPGSAQDYLIEKDARFPSALVVRWLQRCATKALGGFGSEPLVELADVYRRYLEAAGQFDDDLALRVRLLDALDGADPGMPLDEWVTSFGNALNLREVLSLSAVAPDDVIALDSLGKSSSRPSPLSDFARGVQVKDRVVITNCHASKGRQFDVVIMPGLQATLFPFAWRPGSAPVQLAEDRRLFYVGLTRARHRVHLVYSPRFTNDKGVVVQGPSQFVTEVRSRLGPA